MNNKEALFFHFSAKNMSPTNVFCRTLSDPNLSVQDNRVARLLVLLQQLDESPGGLGGLPQAELGEVISSAVRLCGFVNPVEALNVISTILDEIEPQGATSEEAASEEQGTALP